MDKVLNSRVTESVTQFKAALKSHGYSIKAMYVFGSQAKGTQKEWSDIDVAVISPSFNNQETNYYVELSKLSWPIDIDIEPHALHSDDFNNEYSALAQEIKKYGIQI